MTQPDLARVLGLQPHPEGGWFAETWTTAQQFQPEGYPGPRAASGAIYFLLRPGEESRWHTVRSDELWLWHRGGALDLIFGGDGDEPADPVVVRLGPDIAAGERPQLLVPAGVWQAARPAGGQEVLVSCVVAPGFHYDDFRLLPAAAPVSGTLIRSYASGTVPRPVADVWRDVARFGDVAAWHPRIAKSALDPTGAVRHLVTADGEVVEERLVALDDRQRTLAYVFVRSPYAVEDYRATMRVTEIPGTATTLVEWWADFRPADQGTDWWAFFGREIFQPGIDGLAVSPR